MMRTTVNLPDDVTDIVRGLADAKGISLGAAIAELVRRGLRSDQQPGRDEGFPCFAVPPDAAAITLEHTLAAEDDL